MSLTINIVGAGAVGSWLAFQLSAAQLSVSLVDPRLCDVKTLQLREYKQRQSVTINVLPHLETNCHLVICCLKAYQVNTALKQLAPSANTPVVLLNNGMGVAEQLHPWLSSDLFLASNTHGCLLKTKAPDFREVQHTGQGQIQIGAWDLQTPAPDWLPDLQRALPQLKFGWQKNIKASLWQKLAINCCINPLTALYQCRNGELLQPKHAQILSALSKEFSFVSQAEGLDLSAIDLLDKVKQVATATAQNYSSMQQDIALKRRSELDYITGYLLMRAAQLDIKLPHHKSLYQQIKRIEQGE